MDDNEKHKGVLKPHMVFYKTRTTSLLDVKNLNMWGFELEDVSICSQMTYVETISFSLNRISSLSAFSQCYNLKNLFLRQNNICDLKEVYYLKDLPNLENLMLSENPVTQIPNYREFVISVLPRLKKLDDIPCTQALRKPVDPILQVHSSRRIHQPIKKLPPMKPAPRDDTNILNAVLSLIQDLSPESLQTVSEAIQAKLCD